MATEQWHEVTTALVELLKAEAAASRLPLDPEQVFDGPTMTANSDTEWLIVGASWNPDDPSSGDWRQTWASDGGADARRSGVSTIQCGLNAWTGDSPGEGGFAIARERAFAVLAGVENALRANYSLSLPYVLWVEVASGQVTQVIENGCSVFIQFTINVASYI